MKTLLAGMAFALFSLGWLPCAFGENCIIPTGPPESAVAYIESAEANGVSERCVRLAYGRFSELPIEYRVPVLLRLLATPVPPPPKNTLYVGGAGAGLDIPFHPAVEALEGLHEAAIPAIVNYIATDPARSDLGWRSAVYASVVILHPPNAISVLRANRAKAGPSDAARLTDAINSIVRLYCPITKDERACAAAAGTQ
jgi:hypothetical protein